MSIDLPGANRARIVGSDAIYLDGEHDRIPIRFMGHCDAAGAGTQPKAITNWEAFEGALLNIEVRGAQESCIIGSAAMIAPGLAVTANHLFDDRTLSDLDAGDGSLFVTGIRSNCVDQWGVRNLCYDKHEIAYLSLEIMSELSAGWSFSQFGISTRCPDEGERLTVVGSRFGPMELTPEGSPKFGGEVYAAVGEVECAYFPFRLGTRPYPVISLHCETLGAMSGGPVFDDDGLLLGVVSRGLHEHTDVAWIVGGMNRAVRIPWPTGLYEPDSVRVMDIDPRILQIKGREALTTSGLTTNYRSWPTSARICDPESEPVDRGGGWLP